MMDFSFTKEMSVTAQISSSFLMDVLPPQQDPFYAVPLPFPPGPPGMLIRSRPLLLPQIEGLSINAWQIVYISKDSLGKPIAVSGTVLVPKSAWAGKGPRPIISYGFGTIGLSPQCAPSYLMAVNPATITTNPSIPPLLAKGWAVVITDYTSRGVGAFEHYMAGPAYAHAVLDIARASQKLTDVHLSVEAPIALLGLSEGADAVAWAAQLHSTYAPELHIVGTAAVAVPADLNAIMHHIDDSTNFGLSLLTLAGLDAAYPAQMNLNSRLSSEGKTAITYAQSNNGENVSKEYSNRKMSDFTTISNPLDDPSILSVLKNNSLGIVSEFAPNIKIETPIMLVSGTADQLLPFSAATRLRDVYRHMGVSVSWRPIPFAGHIATCIIGNTLALSWIHDRLTETSSVQ